MKTMKKMILSIMLASVSMLGGCSLQQEISETKTYTIPDSYLDFTGMDADEAVNSCLELGEDYCSDAGPASEGIWMELTDEQLDNLVRRNDENIDELAERFTSYDDDYRYISDGTYEELSLYFDEDIPYTLQVTTILGIVSNYGMNHMLLNDTTEWSVRVGIYNCHTDKLVLSVDIPHEEVSYGAEEWKASY